MKVLVAVLIASVIAVPSAVVAHEGHDHRTMGVVSVLHENHLEVKDKDGKTVTFTLEKATKILRGKKLMKVAEIKVGDRVVVVTRETKDKAGKKIVNVREVQVGVAAVPTTTKK